MEVLYLKLYEKFTKLKERRFTELDGLNVDLEAKYIEYVSAADEFIAQLKSETEKLRVEIDDLRKENVLLRSAKDRQYDDFQQLVVQEKQKSRQLSQEVSRLQNLLEEGLDHHQETQQGDTSQHIPISLHDQSTGRKRSRSFEKTGAASSTPPLKRTRVRSSATPPSREKETIYNIDHQQAECCIRSTDDSGACICLFQVLVEQLVGMKFSIIKRSDRIRLCAFHQSSGYSFSLTWLKKVTVDDVDADFLYQVSTLGTFERIAPDWMKEMIIFSFRMFPLFFERVYRVIKQS